MAKEACEPDGFDAFQERFFPKLARSRTYELLQIATGKKSIEEARASNRARVAKHRAGKFKASVTVTEKPALAPEPQEAPTPTEPGNADATCTVTEQTQDPTKPRCVAKLNDEPLFDFSARVQDLIHRTAKHRPKRFSETSVSTDDLMKLGKFLTDLANLKKSDAVERGRSCVLEGNGNVSPEHSAADMKANHTPHEASGHVGT
jgi:hypothetical protein